MNTKIHDTHKKLNITKITNHTVTTTSGFQTLDTAKWPQLRSPCALLTSHIDVKSISNIASKPCDDHSRLTIVKSHQTTEAFMDIRQAQDRGLSKNRIV